MKNLIIINAYPINEFKTSLLEQQLFYFKQLGVKILVVSGCDVPEKLRVKIDYLIVNTDNIRIEKDHTYKCISELGMMDTAYFRSDFHNSSYGVYGGHMNVTICKNIKLSFKMAQMLGYKNIFYTEDDNIFKNGCFDFIRQCFSELDSEQHKLIGCIDDLCDAKCIYTTYFAADVNFLLNKFTIPDTKEGYYDTDNIIKYRLNKPFENSFYHILKNDLYLIKDVFPQMNQLSSIGELECNKSQRTKTKEWSHENLVHVVTKLNKQKYIILHNMSDMVSEELKETFEIDLYFDDVFITKQILTPQVGFWSHIDDSVKNIKVNVVGKFEKEIDVSYDSIKYNGIFFSDYL